MANKQLEKWANKLQDYTEHGVPWQLTGYYDSAEPLTQRQRQELETYLKYHFELWAKSWIKPVIDEMLQKARTGKVNKWA